MTSNRSSKGVACLAAVAVVLAGLVWWLSPRQNAPADATPTRAAQAETTHPRQIREATMRREATPPAAVAQEQEEDSKAEAFDVLTDRWADPAQAGVTMKDVETFVRAFREIPEARQDECVHRALNLIPDENVMLLAGILMDKSANKEIVETVFNDLLNRDETVKEPILRQIYKDKTHVCWADAAWIFDATGEKPESR